MRYTCCPQTDGDAEVWKDRGAPLGIPFSIRDLSSKCTNAPGELLEKTRRKMCLQCTHKFRHRHMRPKF